MLTFVVVGGGPTSVEFTSELYDFLEKDVSKWYKVSISTSMFIEAMTIFIGPLYLIKNLPQLSPLSV